MRKFLAVLMTVLMLASVMAVMPVSAETTLPTCSHDGSTAEQGEAAKMGLVVTEMLTNSTNSYALNSSKLTNAAHQDAFTYIEVYNRGQEPIDLSTLSLARYKDTYVVGSNEFYSDKFESMVDIKAGSIYDGIDVSSTISANACVNPANIALEHGQFAILWIWNDATIAVDTQYANDLGMPKDVDGVGAVYHYYFRQHYGMELNNDIPIYAVYGGDTTSTSDTFTLNKSSNYVYGLVKDSFQLTEAVFEQTNLGTVLNDKVLCTWQWGTGRATGLATAADVNIETANKDAKGNAITVFEPSPYEGMATLYAPANSSPIYYNAQRKALDDTYVDKLNYVDIGSDYVYSYKEMAVMCPAVTAGAATLGKMDDAQWSVVDPETRALQKAQEAGYNTLEEYQAATDSNGTKYWTEDGGYAWVTTGVSTFLAANVATGEGDVATNAETKINLVFKDRSQLGNKGQNKSDQTVDDTSGLPIWALILIIVGGVVLLAGVAVVVIVILKKKNKPVALDDVAAEGEVEIIDETEGAVEEADEEVVVEAAEEENTEE